MSYKLLLLILVLAKYVESYFVYFACWILFRKAHTKCHSVTSECSTCYLLPFTHYACLRQFLWSKGFFSPLLPIMLQISIQFLSNNKHLTENKLLFFFLKLESHKKEMDTFFEDLSLTLKKLQEETANVLAQLQNDCENLREEVEMTRLAHTKVPLEWREIVVSHVILWIL